MSKNSTPTIERVGSHFITLGTGRNWGHADKEELFAYIPTAWRGSPVMVTMRASRYKAGMNADALEWTSWQVYAQDAHEIDENANGGRGRPLTDLARRRLGDQLEPLVREWIDSDAYKASMLNALAHAVRREFGDLRPWKDATRRVRDLLNIHRNTLRPSDVGRFTKAADAYDVFASIMADDD